MIRSKTILLTLGMVVFFAGTVLAAPVTFDGTVNAIEYADQIDDPVGDGVYQTGGWDIKALHADIEGDWLCVGLEVDGTFDADGTEARRPKTEFGGYVTLSPTLEYEMTFVSTSATAATFAIDGTTLTQGVDFDFKIGDDLELMFKKSFMPAVVDSFAFYGWLDDNGNFQDDVIEGNITGVPEPATMALLAFGGLAMLKRRRRV